MTIKARILLVLTCGILVLFGASFYSSSQLSTANERYNSQAALTSLTSAWLGTLDGGYINNLEVFDPLDGAYSNVDYWDYNKNPFSDVGGKNPLHQALRAADQESIGIYADDIFSDAIDSESITFAKIYGADGTQHYCNSSLYLVGVDPCAPEASADYLDEFQNLVDATLRGSKRRMTLITDESGEAPVSVNDTMAFQLSIPGEKGDTVVGLIVLGINIVDGLEMFAENFEVESALVLDDEVVTIYDYYEEQRPDLLSNLIAADSGLDKSDGYTYSNISPDLGYRVTSISLSRETRATDARLLIFDDQSELIFALERSRRQNEIAFSLVGGAIALLVFFITTVSFNRISKSIENLERIERGDLSEFDTLKSTIFASASDEVSRLHKSIEEYRLHRVAAENDRQQRAKRRDERDNIMFEKMSVLAEQLEGGARDLMAQEIFDMREKLSSGNEEAKEQASIEMMSRAFSTMSDEVATLIDARTHELIAARDEISSSIRYAAKLQTALLPKSFPGDIEIEVEWRPRDLVGGDIYFIKDFPDRVYIAVVDCTGHGVPGAFLSIIARSHLDKAIREDQDQTAGEYLTEVNTLLRATLNRADTSNTSEEGFDGGVCIYKRETRTLEFAGAKASLFNVTGTDAHEIGGDRKSVGSSRIPSGFQYSTHCINDPKGAFVMLTDGITDVMSTDERPIAFGRRRVLKVLRDSKDTTPQSIVKEIISSVDLYRGGEPLRDDLTLMAFSLSTPSKNQGQLSISGDTAV